MNNDQQSFNTRVFLKNLFSYVFRYKKYLTLGIISAIMITASTIVNAKVLQRVIDLFVDSKLNSIIGYILIIIISSVICIVSNYLMAYYSGKLGAKVVQDIRNDMINTVDQISMCEIEKQNQGEIVSLFINETSNIEKFLASIPNNVSTVLFVISAALFLMILNWRLFLISFVTTPIAMYLSKLLYKPIGLYTSKYYEHTGKVNGLVKDTVAGINIIKTYNLHKCFFDKCNNTLDEAMGYTRKLLRIDLIMTPITIITYELPNILCIALGGYLVFHGKSTVGSLIAFIQLLRPVVSSATQVPEIYKSIKSASGTWVRIRSFTEQPVERKDGIKQLIEYVEPTVEFKNVFFNYSDHKNTLESISMTLEKGTVTALVGESGSGKSTITNLLASLYNVNTGVISLYGKDINQLSLELIRRHIAIVSQEPILFPVTIEENINYGNLNASHEQIIKAAKIAEIHDFIINLDRGYNTMVGESGMKLSGGQKQRICIARAILKDAPILILDEPTAALDIETEVALQKSLDKISKNKTVLVVAHRLSTIRKADKIIVIEKGKIIETGNHEELMAKSGKYKELYMKQLSC